MSIIRRLCFWQFSRLIDLVGNVLCGVIHITEIFTDVCSCSIEELIKQEYLCVQMVILWDKGVNDAHLVGTAVDIQ